MSLWEYLILFLSVIVGGGIALFLGKSKRSYLHLILSFSGAYILGITVLHLLPTVFGASEKWTGVWILIGFFIQLMLEQLSGGVEHGHIHSPKEARLGFAFQILLGLSVHAFIEGMPLGYYETLHSGHEGHGHGESHLLIGIILHKAPAAFALIVLMLVANYSRIMILTCLFIFASMSPLGAGLGEILDAKGLLDPQMMRNLIALVIGSFLHIATTILFEQDSTRHHNVSLRKLISIILGFAIAMLTMH